MKGKILIVVLLMLVYTANHVSFAQQTTSADLLNFEDTTIEQQLPSSLRDTIEIGDSIIIIHTVCAPICSSRVRVYNKEWQEIGILRPPFTSIFPEAYIENGQILWRDNNPYDYTPVP